MKLSEVLAQDSQPKKMKLSEVMEQEPARSEPMEPPQPQTIEDQLLTIPGMRPIAEMAAAANKSLFQFLDFIGADNVNAVLELAGSDSRMPTLTGELASDGGYMEEGLVRDIIQTTGQTAPLALGVGQGLRTAASKLTGSPVSESVGAGIVRQLGSGTPKHDAAAAALSAAGAEIGEEAAGADGRLAGSVAAPLAGLSISGSIKQLFRGGESGRATLKNAIDDFAEIGTTPTVGQGTQKELLQGVETISRKLIGGGPLTRALEKTTTQMQKRLATIADDLSPIKGDVEAGRVIQSGISGRGGFVERFLHKSGALWREFDGLIDDTAKVSATSTQRALDNLVSDTNIGKVLNNPLISRIKTAFDEAGGSLDYKTLRQLRSTVGRRLGEKSLVSDIPRSELKRLYGAISDDLREVAEQGGKRAQIALKRANTYTASGHKRIDDFVERVTSKADLDRVFNQLARGGEGVQAINAVKRSLKPEEWEAVAANVIRRLGKATPSQQDQFGEVFSVGKMLTDWNKLGRAKNALFSGSPQLNKYRENLDKIAAAAARVKDSASAMANSSGTTQQAANLATMVTGGSALGTGNLGLFFGILSGVAVNKGAARLMTSPRFVNWLAQGTTTSNWSAHISRLTVVQRSLDPETQQHLQSFIENLADQK